MPNSERSVLNRPLSSDAAELLAGVEKMYGCAVAFKPWQGATVLDGGSCTVQDNGTPEITINLAHALWEDAVIHELHHLVLRQKQYPSFSLKNDVGSALKQHHLETLRRLFFELYEPILHNVFNPAIRQMGRNPFVLFNVMFRKNLEPGEMEKNTLRMALPLVNARILLECDEADVREQLRDRCERLGWGKAIEQAKRIVAEIQSMTEPTPKKAVDVLIRCANIAFEGIYKFSEIETIDVRKGPQIEKRVRISVSLPDPH